MYGNSALVKREHTAKRYTVIYKSDASTKETSEAITEIKNEEKVKAFPKLTFTEEDLEQLSGRVQYALDESDVQPAGGFWYRLMKRTFDVAASFTMLAILAIPMGITALAIYCGDRKNPFFAQTRLTENGKPFTMYKFRSMCVDAEKKFEALQNDNQVAGGPAFKMEHDPRVTKIGAFIRKTSIDELPQLVNVLKGDMSFIGPRPPLPREVYIYNNYQMQRLMVKAGLACSCQCSGRSKMSFDEWVDSDIAYIKERSVWADVKLMLKTAKAVITGNGAQ